MLPIYIIYGYFEGNNINRFVDYGKIVFVGITGDWSVTCKLRKDVALYSSRTLDLFQKDRKIQ